MPETRVGLVRLDQVRAHPTNVRRDLGDLRFLSASIARDGIMVPLIVESDGTVLRLRDGHRRAAAARMAGLVRVPAVIHATQLDDASWLRFAVTANNQRKGQSDAERAETVRRMRALGVSRQDIADAYGVTADTVTAWTRPETVTPSRSLTASGKARHAPTTIARSKIAVRLADWRARQDQVTVADILDALEALMDWGEW